MMHMRAGFDHPHNAAVPASRPRRWRARQQGGMLYSRAGELASHNRGPFQRDDGDEGGGMPIPQIVRQWNKAGLNRVTRHIAPWMPGFGVVVHRGRRSGRVYQTPVNVSR
jgi:hypothetical protein